jgi:hypothetical protein
MLLGRESPDYVPGVFARRITLENLLAQAAHDDRKPHDVADSGLIDYGYVLIAAVKVSL